MKFDALNFISGSFGVTAQAFTGQTLAAGTTLGTDAIDHSPALSPQGDNQNVPTLGIGDGKALVVVVTAAPGDTSGGASYTVNLLTDTNSNLTTSPVTLASLAIPNSAVVGNAYALIIPPNMNFKRFAGLQYVLVNGSGTASLGVAAFEVPTIMLEGFQPYESGWVIQNS